ncbi:phosphoglycerate mutase [Sphingobium jiangsuense]|uniref:Broad specificity phosphatase PhoE n=1 Tax=Sphingobium jiangsuense TaxID=870476 RepID=A0A7W6FQV6_9SPHN|nr:histidine phosphatase family protein [Sphingobium jiangsuense]MBB3927360.1 broad specificity phosphatase PhoE [Sphingobium jiangsuense]GLT00762.1 phosphoglycerate mutase [Sphingobium jiangsuense]
MRSIHWPRQLIIVRHGQSAGNVARDAATQSAIDRIPLSERDADVPLSEAGRRQATALGHWFASGREEDRPEVLLSSPYRRTCQTAELFRAAGGCAPDIPICFDERLREKEFGILDGLTVTGIRNLQPEQAALRQLLGKFYHRPPGGESWCDVILRLRSVLDTIALHHADRRVILFTHQVVVLCMRYIIEGMTEAEILAIDRAQDVANCAITDYRLDSEGGDGGALVLHRYNVTAPMREEAAPVTRAPDAIQGVRG